MPLRPRTVLLAVAFVAVAVVVVLAFAPSEQKGEGRARHASPARGCAPCPLPAPGAHELAVAEGAGSAIVAVWLRPRGDTLLGKTRVLGESFQALDRRIAIGSAADVRSCGVGCRTFRLAGRPTALVVRVRDGGRWYAARLPARWAPARNRLASRVVARTARAMRRLRSVRAEESLSSGPGSSLATRYRLRAPDRFAYRLGNGAQTVIIGKDEWSRSRRGAWRRDLYGGGDVFRAADYLSFWARYARNARLLALARTGGRPVADIAMMSPHSDPAVWLRLRIDVAANHVLELRMITIGHFMTQRWSGFNRPLTIRAPAR